MDCTTEETSPSVERRFDGLPYPGFWEQVTVRSMAIAVVLAAILSLVTLRIYMTVGVVGALNMPTNVLSFFSVKSLVSLQRRYGIAAAPFTRQENIFLQTCVITCVNTALSGKAGNFSSTVSVFVVLVVTNCVKVRDRFPANLYLLAPLEFDHDFASIL